MKLYSLSPLHSLPQVKLTTGRNMSGKQTGDLFDEYIEVDVRENTTCSFCNHNVTNRSPNTGERTCGWNCAAQ